MNFQGCTCNCRNCFCLPSEKESTLKGKNLFRMAWCAGKQIRIHNSCVLHYTGLQVGPTFPTFPYFFWCSYFSLLFSENALLSLLFSPKMFEVIKNCIFIPSLAWSLKKSDLLNLSSHNASL